MKAPSMLEYVDTQSKHGGDQMIHIAVDQSKKKSYVVAMNDKGEIHWEGNMANSRDALQELKETLPKGEPVQSVLEAGRNWGILYDLMEELELHPKLANPVKMRIIAETFTKTDKIDATTHAIILKAGLTPLVHVPTKEVRDQKNLLRQRMWLVKMQTMIKNRIHNIIDRNHLTVPEDTDLFGTHGKSWIKALELPDLDAKLLKSNLEILGTIQSHMRQTEKWIDETLKVNPNIPILLSFPGIGKILAALIALEIDTIQRFPSPAKFCAYSGLANSTYSSGEKTSHGPLIPSCNRHLRYAFVEAAWTATRVSPYFSAFFKRLKSRVGSYDAIGAAARKLCEITYFCLKQQRNYKEKPYQFKFQRKMAA
jgi:transposase